MTPTRHRRRLRAVVGCTVALLAALVLGPLAGAQPSPVARSAATNSGNPLAGGTWGVYTGSADGVYPAYQQTSGADQALLAKVALRPRVRWFGTWMSTGDAADKLRDYIATTQAGDPDVLVQLAIFRLWPNGGEPAKDKPLSTADQDAYRQWIDAAEQAIGGARVAIVLEPDLAVALNGWRPRVRMQLTAYAARVLGALPRAAVYIDASDADWLSVSKARRMLLRSGIKDVRGFALGATHYSGTAANIRYGRQLVAALAAAGVRGRHFVIDTADNGRPFTWPQYWAKHPRGDFDNAEPCRSLTERRCNTLGIPPTADVADPRWGLPAKLLPAARAYVDGYLWFGRPWLVRQSSPFDLQRTLQVARTTRY
jgi:endoglucanase